MELKDVAEHVGVSQVVDSIIKPILDYKLKLLE
jgi:hypothetical protein